MAIIYQHKLTFDVLVTDQRSPKYEQNAEYFAGLDSWAQVNLGNKYVGYAVQDVSDVSGSWDEIACYSFTDEDSANWFKLRCQD
jgi:hypothetical protein